MNKLIDWIANALAKQKGIATGSEEFEVLKYKTTIRLYDLWKDALLLLIATCLGIFVQTTVMLVSVKLIKRYSFGFHMNKIMCLIVGLLTLLAPPLLFTGSMSTQSLIAVYVVANILFFAHAPKATENRPILASDAKVYKVKLFTTTTALMVVAILFDGFVRNMIASSFVVCAVSVLPIAYRLSKTKVIPYAKDDAEFANSAISKDTLSELTNKITSTKIAFKTQSVVLSCMTLFVTAGVTIVNLLQVPCDCMPPAWFNEPETPDSVKKHMLGKREKNER